MADFKTRPLIALAVLAAGLGMASAQSTNRAPAKAPAKAAPTSANTEGVGADAKRAELDAIAREITLSEARQEALRDEISDLVKDNATLNKMLVDTTSRARRLESQLDQSESRLRRLIDQEQGLQQSLRARRGVLAEVLAALQRMGRHPPPAIVVRPEDALIAVRSAILLGAVVPEIRLQAEALAMDLKQLVDLKTDMAGERDRLRADATTLAEEEKRVELLLGQKHRAQSESEIALDTQRRKATELAEKASSLKELITSLEREVPRAAAAADKAKLADQARLTSVPGKVPAKPASLGNSDRIAPAVAFAEAKGLLPRPVSGTELKHFGEDDGLGGKSQGLSLATRAASRVSSPSDGWVVFSGPFRSYGQLLIINAGGGYHILLAGMERIDVELGQFVLAGEPVAIMGDRRLASVGPVETGGSQPVLYVEFRKDSNAVDPGPWWASRSDEKAGG